MANYFIVTPSYSTSSAGVKLLHMLCHALNQNGKHAKLIFTTTKEIYYGNANCVCPELKTPPAIQGVDIIDDNSIVIYPEVVTDNPLNAKNVVRYFLYYDSKIMGKKVEVGARDFTISYSKQFYPTAHYTLFSPQFNPIFNTLNTKPLKDRQLDITYIGKGNLYGNTSVIKNSLYIDRNWPAGQEQLSILLKQTRFFYTWDSVTSMIPEAVLCGAMPVFLRFDPIDETDVDTTELGPIPRLSVKSPNFNFSYSEFVKKKETLEGTIKMYKDSWYKRVLECASMAEAHFKL